MNENNKSFYNKLRGSTELDKEGIVTISLEKFRNLEKSKEDWGKLKEFLDAQEMGSLLKIDSFNTSIVLHFSKEDYLEEIEQMKLELQRRFKMEKGRWKDKILKEIRGAKETAGYINKKDLLEELEKDEY